LLETEEEAAASAQELLDHESTVLVIAPWPVLVAGVGGVRLGFWTRKDGEHFGGAFGFVAFRAPAHFLETIPDFVVFLFFGAEAEDGMVPAHRSQFRPIALVAPIGGLDGGRFTDDVDGQNVLQGSVLISMRRELRTGDHEKAAAAFTDEIRDVFQ